MLKALIFIGMFFTVLNVQSAEFIRGPYLQNITSTSVTFKMRTDVPANYSLHVATNNVPVVFRTFDVATDQELLIAGLTPDTDYTYEIRDNDTNVVVLSGPLYTFKTAPVSGTPGEYRFWAIGDSGTANADANNVYQAYMSATGSKHTDVWLMLGDNAYTDGTEAEYQAAVFDMYTDMLPNTGLWSTRGNHERDSSVYYNNYVLPSAGEGGGIPSGTEAYYSFDYGNVHFVCLDSYDTDRSVGGAMYNWLEADLAATSAEFIIAYFHHPPYTKGSHDSDNRSDSTGRMHEMRERFLPVLEAYGTDLVLSGHSHSYERSFYMAGHYGDSSTFDQEHNIVNGGDGDPIGNGEYSTLNGTGTVYITAGNGGKVTGTLTRHNAIYAAIYELGGVIMDVSNQVMRVQLLDDQARVLDDFTISHDVTELPEVAGDQVLVTQPNYSQIEFDLVDLGGSDTELTLYWGLSDEGKQLDAWDLQVSLGTVATTGLYSTVLSGLTDQATYFYRIYAQNADGGSYSPATGSWLVDQSSSGVPNIEFVNATPPPAPATVIPTGAVWSYDDDGSQDAGWKQLTFDDSGWDDGDAQLGYGNNGEDTVVSFGGNSNNKHITTWFRHTFTENSPERIASMTMNLLRDDGAVVYVNGTEVARSNMPSGTITPNTTASGAVGGSGEDVFHNFSVSPALLVPGENVVAVEIHQVRRTSSDLSFDFELIIDAYHVGPVAQMTNITATTADGIADLLSDGNLPATAHVLYGTTFGGTDLSFWQNSATLSASLGEQSFALTNLTPETIYFVRLYAENMTGGDWSEDTLSFVTDVAPPPPPPPPPDSDNDGLLDVWEFQYFGDLASTDGTLDSDGDGRSDAAEFQAGTHPLDPLSSLVLYMESNLDGSEHILNWTNTGVLVDIQQCPDLNDPNGWQPLQFDVGDGVFTNGVVPGERIFYRLMID